MHPNKFMRRRAAGIALPVTLMILALMLVGSVYLLKSVHSTGLTTGNLAYDSTLSREADLGLHAAFDWLNTTAATNKVLLNTSSAANGYVASLNSSDIRNGNTFWAGSKILTDADGTRVEYVIHRLCSREGAYNDPLIKIDCVQTSPNTSANGNAVQIGFSTTTTAPVYNGTPRLHYTVTARIAGSRGASVTNQMIVLIGA